MGCDDTISADASNVDALSISVLEGIVKSACMLLRWMPSLGEGRIMNRELLIQAGSLPNRCLIFWSCRTKIFALMITGPSIPKGSNSLDISDTTIR